MPLSRRFLSVLLLLFASLAAHGQDYAQFNVILDLNYASAERSVELYTGLGGRPEDIARLRGSQIAVATTELLAQRRLDLSMLQSALELAKFNQTITDDVFHIQDARKNAAAIKELLVELSRRNFGQKVISTVEQLFPGQARVTTRIPIYFVAFGHQNIDAYVRRVVWRGDVPVFVGEGKGEVTIVVNLAKAVYYGRTVDECFLELMSVVAHEVFHAAFGVYKDGSPSWRSYYAAHTTPFDQLLDLAHNEGIAYYLTLVQRSRGRLVLDWEQRAREAFAEFNRRAEELLSPRTPPRRAGDIIRMANTSGYWESYGAIAGMIVARQIDQTLGRAALVETVERGPGDFFQKYAELQRRDSNFPQLSDPVLRAIAPVRR